MQSLRQKSVLVARVRHADVWKSEQQEVWESAWSVLGGFILFIMLCNLHLTEVSLNWTDKVNALMWSSVRLEQMRDIAFWHLWYAGEK